MVPSLVSMSTVCSIIVLLLRYALAAACQRHSEVASYLGCFGLGVALPARQLTEKTLEAENSEGTAPMPWRLAADLRSLDAGVGRCWQSAKLPRQAGQARHPLPAGRTGG